MASLVHKVYGVNLAHQERRVIVEKLARLGHLV